MPQTALPLAGAATGTGTSNFKQRCHVQAEVMKRPWPYATRYTRRRTFFGPSPSVQNDLSSIAAAEVAADTHFAVLRVVEAGSDLGICTAGTPVTSIYVQRKVRPTPRSGF